MHKFYKIASSIFVRRWNWVGLLFWASVDLIMHEHSA